ncbi:MAG: hypothetical protein QXD13_00440, partial [Candidatus Pacearchaeota archaeon]
FLLQIFMLVKILGGIDLLSSFVLLMLIFGFHPFTDILLFCAGLLFFKGLFVLTGDVLSVIDLFSSSLLILAIFFALPIALLWISAFLLLAKGFVSFL